MQNQKHVISEPLHRLGGEADMGDIYEWIEEHVDLPDHELGDSGYDGRPRYRHSLRNCVSIMVGEGRLVRIAPGRYAGHIPASPDQPYRQRNTAAKAARTLLPWSVISGP